MKKLESHDWWPELLSLKDELSLRELGERFGVTPGAVMNALRRNGIERKPAPPGPRRNRKTRAPVQEALPPEPGTTVSRSRSKDAQIEAYVDLLGKVPDREVAKKAGVSLRTVASYRARHGIAGYAGPRKRVRRGRRSKIDPFASEVGTVPDRVIAEKAGVSTNAVRNWRKVRGIPARGRRGSAASVEPAPPTAAAAAAAPTSSAATPRAGSGAPGSFAWRVTLADGTVGVVVGNSLVEAATRAESAGSVASMERIGALL